MASLGVLMVLWVKLLLRFLIKEVIFSGCNPLDMDTAFAA
jgi:hypothetical protein